MATIGQIPDPNRALAYDQFEFEMRGGDNITNAIAQDLRAANPLPSEYSAPDEASRLAGIAKGENLGTRPGRRAREEFEARPTRVAARTDRAVYRGSKGMIHADVFTGMIKPYEGLQAQDVFDLQMDAEDTGDVGYTDREGKFINRDQAAARMGFDVEDGGMGGESFVQRKLLSDMSPAERKAMERAGTVNPQRQYQRRTRGRKAHESLGQINKERSYLERINKFMQSENVSDRIKDLTRRAGNLKNLARQRGLMGIANLGMFATPSTTGEAITGLTSDNANIKMKSIETLLGMPEFATGRQPTPEEVQEGKNYVDRMTGEVIGGAL